MGSTVVVLFESPRFAFDPELADGNAVRMGQALGSFVQS
jgi:phosphatidylserine decarboxylase